jgi:hypothetical protein
MATMSTSSTNRRRPSVHITLQRAARLHRLVRFLAQASRTREVILSQLNIGLRTFYRELELLKKCGIKIRHKQRQYGMQTTAEQAEGLLPFPDPQLSFAEMAELSSCPCEAGKRLADLLASVVNQPAQSGRGKRTSSRSKKSKKKGL